jgi:hypothetical protein
MNGFSRALAVVATATIMSSSTVSAIAAEATAATHVTATTSPIKHRRVATRDVRHVAAATPLQGNLGCSGEWCGRQFVLMIGIGF